MSLNSIKNTHLTRNLTADDAAGKPYSVVSFTGQVNPEKSLTLSVVISDMQKARENEADIALALNDFWAEIRAAAKDNGLPV